MDFVEERQRMVEQQLRGRGIEDERVLDAFLKIPRELFIPDEYRSQAYLDHPIPIGCDQTISQPFIVGLMVGALRLKGDERVLEIGTGSGYQTALLSLLVSEVFSIERIAELSASAANRLKMLNAANVTLKVGDGTLGYPAQAPYDAIIVSAASPELPQPLLDQLKSAGRLVLPVGTQQVQTLLVLEKTKEGIKQRVLGECVFVPLIGRFGWAPSSP